MSRKSLVDIRECMLCFFISQQPDSICIKSSCWQPGKGVVRCVEYHWTSLNGCSSTTELSPMARGWEFPLAFMSMLLLWETKVIELKKEFQVVVCRLDFDLFEYTRSCHDPKCDAQELEVGWKSTSRPLGVPELVPRPLLSPWISYQAQNWFPRPLSSPGTGSKASF